MTIANQNSKQVRIAEGGVSFSSEDIDGIAAWLATR
jgi:hypothetical protein